MAEIIGKVLDKANADGFQFVSTKFFDAKYIEVSVDHIEAGAKIIGEITNKETLNPHFEKPSDIRYIKEEDESVGKKSLYIAKVRSLALVIDGQSKEVSFPPLPGSNVFEAKVSNIKTALKLANEGIDIGEFKGYKLHLKISPDNLLRTHISILGQTGSGKSYLAEKLAVELLKQRHDANVSSEKPSFIIFDSSGEYTGKYDSSAHGKIHTLVPQLNIKDHYFPLLSEKYLSLLYDIYGIDEKQESDLRMWLNPASYKDKVQDNPQKNIFLPDGCKKLIEEFAELRINSTKQLANELEEGMKKYNQLKPPEKVTIPFKALSRMRRFNLKIKKTDDMSLADQLSRGLIIDLSEQNDYEERQIAMLLFLRQLYEMGKYKKLKSKVILFIDEAHNYVPSVYKSHCKDEILRLAREGRKYGITLCLISQRPRWVDPTALSQCGALFIFRIQNSDDKKHIFDSASLPDTLRDINIAKFKTGELIITGDIADYPLNCIVSPIDEDFINKKSKESAKGHMEEIKDLFDN